MTQANQRIVVIEGINDEVRLTVELMELED
jgi:hypothetical protein